MKKSLILMSAALALLLVALSAAGQEKPGKKFEIHCGEVSGSSGWSPGTGAFWIRWSYRAYSDDAGEALARDFAIGVLVPVCIEADKGITVRTGEACWSDFVSVDIRRVKLAEDSWWSVEEFIKPKSSWKTSLFAAGDCEPGPMDSWGEMVWMKVTFDKPEALEEGYYVFIPRVDFAAMAKPLPDLCEKNLEEPLKFETTDFEQNDFLYHRGFNLNSDDGRRSAINTLLIEAQRMRAFGKRDLAHGYFDRVFKINENSVAGRITLTGMYHKDEDTQKALACMLEALEVAQSNSDRLVKPERTGLVRWVVYKWTGYLYHVLRQFDEAEYYYLRAIEMINDEAFDPGPRIDDTWGWECSVVYGYMEIARKREPLDKLDGE